jgi:SAM-dependent methyltransferase
MTRFAKAHNGELPMGNRTRFDRAYFDRWYRDPRRRVLDRSEIGRRAALVLSIAEYVLERPVRSALDVGCGEGNWRAPLLARRPRLRYVGVDPSEYVVQRYGRRRNIIPGTAESLDTLPLRGPFDVVIASGVLNFLSEASLRRAARTLGRLTSGIAFFELFTSADDVVGDTRGWRPRSAAFYRRVLRQAGFTQCGPHCYAARSMAGTLAALERAG